MVHTDIRGWLMLSFADGIGPVTAKKLLEQFNSASDLFTAGKQELQDRGISASLIQVLLDDYDARIDHALEWQAQGHGQIICQADDHYPVLLREIPDPPLVLYARGQVDTLKHDQLAIVGSRHATHHGLEIAFEFANSLVKQGWTITSGLAYGIDAAAHKGALAGKGATIAVAGTGVDRFYPARNAKLAEKIIADGLLLSEFPLGTQPLAGNFPRRNRIISGLSRGTIIVEAAIKSGSLITARMALEQGREVFAIPGSIHQAQSKGCHRLLKEGASLLETLDDIDEIFHRFAGPSYQGKTKVEDFSLKHLGDDYVKVLAAVDFAPTSIEQVIQRCGLTPRSVCSMLLTLEMKSFVCMSEPGLYSKTIQDS